MFLSRTWLICRVCMKQKDRMVNLFTQIADQPLWNLLRDCGGIPVRKNDNLPDKMCEHCIERLWKAHAFRLDCQSAHREITQVVQPNLTDEDEFLPEHGPDKISLLDKYHTEIIDQFEAQKCNGYQGSNSSIDSFSTTCDDQAIKSKLYTQRKANKAVEEELVDIDKNCHSIMNTIKTEDGQRETVLRPQKKWIAPSSKSAMKSIKLKPRRRTTKGKSSRLGNNQHSKRAYLCNVCENVYSSAELLRHHMYIHSKPHICNVCGKMFSQIQQFTNHKNSHSGLQPYPCRMCARTFADTSNRNKHEKTVHKRMTVRKYPKSRECFICNKIFESLSSLREHHHHVHLKSLTITD